MANLQGKKLLVFGDSIINGSGNNGVGVGEFLAERYGMQLVKYCVGGARVGYNEGKSWVVEQVVNAIENGEKADLIVFNGFTNDCCKTDNINCDVPLGEISAGFEGFDIFSVSKDNTTFSNCFENIACAFKKYFGNAKILFMRPHRMGRREERAQIEYGERAVALCNKWNISVVDLYKDSGVDTFLPEHRDKYTADTYGWGTGDCTHPNALCYREKYMPLIFAAVEKIFGE